MKPANHLPSLFVYCLYRGRVLAVAVALLFVLYNTLFFSFYVPFGGPYVHWRPDSRLLIAHPVGQSEAFLQSGDEVLALDNRPLVRTQPIYPLPLQREYDFTIQRDGSTVTYNIPVYAPLNEYAVQTFLPTVLLAVAGWVAGTIMLFFAKRDNDQALYAGYIFLLSTAVLIGIQGSLEGVPGAWIAGHCLIFILPGAWIYLGLIPRATPVPKYGRTMLTMLFGVGGVLAGLAAYEVLSLFPQRSSFEEMTGISLYGLSFLFMALGLIACTIILAVRTWRLPKSSYIRQQLLLLLLFFAIGVFPTTLLTIIPRALSNVVLLPFPVGIALMMFIPAGYLFVIYRRGFLGLDPLFNRVVYLTILSLGVFVFYSSGLYLVQQLLQLDALEVFIPATLVFFPTLLVTVYASKPVNAFVQGLLYGKHRPDASALAGYTMALSAKPEMETLEQIVVDLAGMVQISQAALLLKEDKDVWYPVTQLGITLERMNIKGAMLDGVTSPLLRSSQKGQGAEPLFQLFNWAELLIPMIVRNEQVGILALGRPNTDGYFNSFQVSFLQQVAGILAVGSENINLFEMTRALAREALTVQERERLALADSIHDDPLQQITYVNHLLTQLQHEPKERQITQNETVLPVAVEHLKSVATNLRQICMGLRPPFWDQGVEIAVCEVVGQVQEQYGLDVNMIIAPEISQMAVSDNVTLSLCRILNAALNNVVKHAPGATAQVGLSCCEDELVLTVKDNGPGCNLLEDPSSYSDLMRQHHFGIVGMLEWAKLVNGRLHLKSAPKSGMEIIFSCPLQQGKTYRSAIYH